MSLPPEAMQDAAYALGLWTAWGLLHSLLAADRLKEAVRLVSPGRYALYPFLYSVISVWTFWLVLAKEPDLPQVLWAVEGAPKSLLYGLQAAGAGLLLWAGFSMPGLKLLGLRQLADFLRGGVPEEADLRQDFSARGAYALVRHPMHSGGMLLLACQPHMTLGALVFALFGCAYMILGTLLEERRLSLALGPVWADYVRRVPMFVPFLQSRHK